MATIVRQQRGITAGEESLTLIAVALRRLGGVVPPSAPHAAWR